MFFYDALRIFFEYFIFFYYLRGKKLYISNYICKKQC